MYEVYCEAPEPWTQATRDAFDRAILKFVESPISLDDYHGADPEDNNADAQLAAGSEDYVGWGANAHPDADGPVFDTADAAQRFKWTLDDQLAEVGVSNAHTSIHGWLPVEEVTVRQ